MIRDKVLRTIAQIEEQKRIAGIVPPYATMGELHARLTTEDLRECASMVQQGLLLQHENINGPMYSVGGKEQR